jgi:hypothetical protein
MMRLYSIMAQLYKKVFLIMGFDKKHFYAYSNTVWQFLDSQTLKFSSASVKGSKT